MFDYQEYMACVRLLLLLLLCFMFMAYTSLNYQQFFRLLRRILD